MLIELISRFILNEQTSSPDKLVDTNLLPFYLLAAKVFSSLRLKIIEFERVNVVPEGEFTFYKQITLRLHFCSKYTVNPRLQPPETLLFQPASEKGAIKEGGLYFFKTSPDG